MGTVGPMAEAVGVGRNAVQRWPVVQQEAYTGSDAQFNWREAVWHLGQGRVGPRCGLSEVWAPRGAEVSREVQISRV